MFTLCLCISCTLLYAVSCACFCARSEALISCLELKLIVPMSHLHTAYMCSYDAATAGLSYSIDFTTKGLRLAFGGWNDKMPDFIQV
jgi:secreted Zn-dependent insulinase-like peptidase